MTSSYLHTALDPVYLDEMTASYARLLEPHLYKFDTIAFRGMSGALVAPLLATKLNKQLLMVRKHESHSAHMIEGVIGDYLIVDDIVVSGTTIKAIKDGIAKEYGYSYKCAGVLLFNQPIGCEAAFESEAALIGKLCKLVGQESFFLY